MGHTAAATVAVVIGSLVVTSGCSRVGSGADEFRGPDAPPRTITAAEIARRAIDPDDMRRHIEFLASEELRGRGTPSRGLTRAAGWVAEQFQLAGLEPAGEGGYVQYWSTGPDTARAPNVVGLLSGADLARSNELVVLVAHLDHLGVRPRTEDGDSLHPGADDNASGVAALVEIARAFAALPEGPPRSVLFLVVSGREQGLRGSRWFVENPTLDLAEAIAVLNLDMISRNPPDTVTVLDRDAPELGERVVRTAAATDPRLVVVRDPPPRLAPEIPTDHAPFTERGLAAVTISTGRHEHTHTPLDTPRRVNPRKAARVARLVFLTAYDLAGGAPEMVVGQ